MSHDNPAPAAPMVAEHETAPGILPPQHWAQIAQEDDEQGNSEIDSAIDSDNASSTASMTSSIFQYRTIHGRTYHSDQGNAQYWGSNDQAQLELMDLTHHILTIGLGNKLHLAPLQKDKVHQVIDIGTGTGIWAIDFSDEYPGTEIIATDISPSQPSWVPPNLRFEIEDCTQEWTFTSDFADYIHIRWLVGSIKDWDALSSEALRVCKPGGWVESHEASSIIQSDDNTVDSNSAMGHWGKFFIEGSKKLGSSFTVVEDGTQRKSLEKAGFINIQEFDFKNPIGEWPTDPIMKEMGPYTKYGLETDSEGFVLFMAHTLGWSKDEIMDYISQFLATIKEHKRKEAERKRREWEQKLASASEEERLKLIESRRELRKERMEKRLEEREKTIDLLTRAKEEGQNIVVDLEFSDLMTPNEIQSLVQQVMYCYAVNRRCTSPAHLWLTGYGGDIETQLRRLPGFEKWVIEKENRSYIEAFQDQREKLVYLTADAETVLDELDPKKTYVVGGLVDRNRWKGITMKKAKDQGIQTAKLPIESYLKMSSSQVLTVNQVVEILLKFLETRDWKISFFQVIPQRKRCEAEAEAEAEEEEDQDEDHEEDSKKKKCTEPSSENEGSVLT